MKFLTRLCCVVLAVLSVVIPSESCFAAYQNGYKLYDNYTLLSEDEKVDEPAPTDELYDYTLKYSTGTRARGMQVNLWYMRSLGNVVTGGGKKLDFIRDKNSAGGTLKLYKSGTLLDTYKIQPELSSFAAMQDYKLLVSAKSENNGYDARVRLFADSEVNTVSAETKTQVGAEKFFYVSSVTTGGGVTVVKNSCVQYYVETEKAGYYALKIQRNTPNLVYLDISVNDEKAEYDVNSGTADVWLDEGINTLSLNCVRGSACITALDFTPYICRYRFDETSNFIYVSGTAKPGADVSAVLTAGGEITPSAIVNITQTVAADDGTFYAEFMLTGNLEQQVLSVNAGGIFWKLESAERFESCIGAEGTLTLELAGGKAVAGAEFNNTLRGNYDECHIIVAFYNAEKRLLDIKSANNFEKTFSCDVPDGAAYANAYLWESAENMTPFAESKRLDFETGK